MAQECGFFNAELEGEEYDRVYNAEQFAAYFASFVGNGVFGGSMSELVVVENETPNMSVNVSTGKAWINGWWYRNNDLYNLSVDVADGVLNRIDIVVLRWGNTERDMWVQVVKGTPSANPVAPTITRNADYYDLKLCEISVPAGAVNIRQAQISDTRPNTNVCGFVTGLIDQIDAGDLFLQFQSQFNIWFDHMKGQLSEDAAGHLQQEVDDINELKQDKKDNALSTTAKTVVGAINELLEKFANYFTKSEINTSLANKVDKVSGKGLSTNDFTNTLLNKLNGIAAGAQVNSITGVKGNAERSYRTGDVNISAAQLGFNWSGRTGQPKWLWGGDSNNDFWLYNPSNFSVNYAASAETATTANSIKDGITPTFSQMHLTGEIIYANNTNLQLSTITQNATIYLRSGSVECTFPNSFTKRPITASAFVVESSKRIKENIVSMSDEEAKKILDVDVVDFDYIKEVGGLKNQHGVIAEELYKLIPYAVVKKDDDDGEDISKAPGVDYAKLVPYLIKTVQIQQKEIDELKRRVYDLERGY